MVMQLLKSSSGLLSVALRSPRQGCASRRGVIVSSVPMTLAWHEELRAIVGKCTHNGIPNINNSVITD